MPASAVRRFALRLLPIALLGSLLPLTSGLAGASEPFTDTGTIENPNPSGTSVTRDEFIALCPNLPATQGFDGFIFVLPDGFPAEGATATMTATNAAGSHNLVMSIWFEDCAFDEHVSPPDSPDVTHTLEAGTKFLAAVTTTGFDTTVTLTVTPAGPDPGPTPSPSPTSPGGGTRGTYPLQPNDPLFPARNAILGGQWGMRQIQAPEAWQEPAGSDVKVTGFGIKVAVLDSGLDLDHPDFACPGKIGLIEGNDPFGDGNGPEDGNGHGTHVSGIVGACTNNGEGVVGVAPDSTILPVQICGADSSCNFSIALPAGIRSAIQAGAHVINLSVGVTVPGLGAIDELFEVFEEADRAIEEAQAAGVVVVAAAGNNAADICSYPAIAEDVICVGATDSRDQKSWFSNFPLKNVDDGVVGPAVVAPGGSGQVFCDFHAENILSTYLVEQDNCDEGFEGYRGLDGTSMASPHVAGVAALVYDRLGGARSAENGALVVQSIIESADDLFAPGFDAASGSGRVNALRAVQAAPVPPPPQVSDTEVAFTGDVPSSGQFTDRISLSARLTDDQGTPIPDEELSFQLLGRDGFRELAAQTGADGVAQAELLLDAPPGDYEVIVAYAGKTDTYNSSSDRRPFTILKEDSALTLALSGKGSKRILTARLFDSDDEALGIADRLVTFFADGKAIGNAITDADGVAIFDVPPGNRGRNVAYEVSFAGDGFFLESEAPAS